MGFNVKYCGNSNHTQARITIQEISTAHRYDNTEILNLTIIYPKIELENNQDVERRINDHIAAQVEQYIKHAKELYKQAVQAYLDSQAQDFPFHAWEAHMEFFITYNDNCFLSMYTDRYEYTGGAHGNTIRTSETWELTRGGMQRSLEYASTDPVGLVIYYQQYDLAPYATGIVQFTIPYETIGWCPHCLWMTE